MLRRRFLLPRTTTSRPSYIFPLFALTSLSSIPIFQIQNRSFHSHPQHCHSRQQKPQQQQYKHQQSASVPTLPHADSPLIPAVLAELFRLCTTNNITKNITSTTNQGDIGGDDEGDSKPASASNPRWVNIGLITKMLPDDLLEAELEKFKSGIREVVGTYLTVRHNVQLRQDQETKTWFAKTEPVRDELADLNRKVEFMIEHVWKNPMPPQTGDIGEYLQNPFTWANHKAVPHEVIKRLLTPAEVEDNARLYQKIVSLHGGLARASWRCTKQVPTCRWELFDPVKQEKIEVRLVRDRWMRRTQQEAFVNRLQVEHLVGLVPTFFIPMEVLVKDLEPQGYNENHIHSFFSLSRNVQIVRLPSGASGGDSGNPPRSYIRLHGGSGECKMWDCLATNSRHVRFEPRAKLAGKYIEILQEHFQKERFCNGNEQKRDGTNQQEVATNFSNSSTNSVHEELRITNEVKWMTLRVLLERGGKDLESQLPWKGPEALLYFAQLQHIFCFTPDGPDGGSVCLQPYFYPNYIKLYEHLNVSFRQHSLGDAPQFLSPLLPVDLKPTETPLPTVMTELARVVRKKSALSVAETLEFLKSNRHANLAFGECFEPVFQLAPRENIIPPEELYEDGFAYEMVQKKSGGKHSLGASSSANVKSPSSKHTANEESSLCRHGEDEQKEQKDDEKQEQPPRLFEDYLMLFIRLHSKLLTWNYETKRLCWLHQLQRLQRHERPIDERIQAALHDGVSALKLRALYSQKAKEEDPDSPFWDSNTLFHEVVKYIPTDRYVTTAEWFNFIVPRHLIPFFPSVGPQRFIERFPDRILTFNMMKKEHFHHLQQQKGLLQSDEAYIMSMFPANMFFVDPSTGSMMKQIQYLRCIMRMDDECEYFKKLQEEGGGGGDEISFGSTSSPSCSSSQQPHHQPHHHHQQQQQQSQLSQSQFLTPLEQQASLLPRGARVVARQQERSFSSSSSSPSSSTTTTTSKSSSSGNLQQQQQQQQQHASSKVVSTNAHTRLTLPHGAIAIEQSSEEIAKIIMDIIIRCGLRDPQQQAYRIDAMRLKDLFPDIRMKGGVPMPKMQQFIHFLELHPDKFILVGSGKMINSVILNMDYFRKQSTESSS